MIQDTMKRASGKSDCRRNLRLVAIGLVAVIAPALFGLLSATRAGAQGTQAEAVRAPEFEVASIKPNHSDGNMIRMGGPDVSRFVATSVTAKMLITFAYNLRDFQVSGGPSWIGTDRFDVDAKVEDSVVEQLQKLPRAERYDQLRLMMQSLLAERFQLTVTHENKELPVFALVVAKGGPKLTEVQLPPPNPNGVNGPNNAPPPPAPPAARGGAGGGPPTPPPGGMFMSFGGKEATLNSNGTGMANLATMLSNQLNRVVLDETGLKGVYSFTLKWTPENVVMNGVPAPDTEPLDTSGPTIMTAIQEQLGLKLESKKAPVDSINITRIEKPSEN